MVWLLGTVSLETADSVLLMRPSLMLPSRSVARQCFIFLPL